MKNNFIPLAKPFISDDEVTAVTEVIKSGWWTTGPKVAEFESEISKYIGGGVSAVALSSATGGLFLSLKALGVGPGDEVIVPAITFVASAHVVEWLGAKVVLCDIDRETLNIDVNKIEALITDKTKVIMPVHIGGYPCEMSKVKEIARRRGLRVVEDAAHAIGTKYEGEAIGTHGDAVVFSFYATKNLACGEGGMVVSKDPGLIEKIRKSSYFGVNKDAFKRYDKSGSWFYEVEELGYKYNFDSIHAALGLAQLKKLDLMNKRRGEIAARYKAELDTGFGFQNGSDSNYHAYHLFIIRVPVLIISRNDMFNMLKERNIGSSVHFIPIHHHPYYRDKFRSDDYPVSNNVFETILSIPMYPSMSDEEVGYVIENVNGIIRSLKK